AGKLGGLEFDDAQVPRVLHHVQNGRRQTGSFIILEQSGRLEQQQGATSVGRVVLDSDSCTIRNLVKAVVAVGIEAHREDQGRCHGDNVEAAVLLLILQIGFVLKGIEVDLAV